MRRISTRGDSRSKLATRTSRVLVVEEHDKQGNFCQNIYSFYSPWAEVVDANAEALEAEINGEVTSCSCDSCSNNESNDRGVSVYGKTSGT
ncbi:uncharacterized protein [Triticum aestivum]|uniref:uncharacterized protein isoform X2 n=1 Tax=Triticum aestivum TaxID=4565 RepID=UPI001D01DD4A|nr:uncharacterized protein LOC123068662 isoform X2 [Triticum aestivum]